MRITLCLAIVLLAQTLHAGEAVVTLRSTVTGNQELPRVMYIVPWQQPGDSDFDYELQGSFADELFAPIDRDEFVRGIEYQAMIEAGEPGGDTLVQQQTFNND